jgi:hypothetical protein
MVVRFPLYAMVAEMKAKHRFSPMMPIFMCERRSRIRTKEERKIPRDRRCWLRLGKQGQSERIVSEEEYQRYGNQVHCDGKSDGQWQ